MKKLFAILLVMMIMLSACEKAAEENFEKEPLGEKENIASEETLDIIKDCIFKENGKYGVQHEGKIIAEAVYDEYRELGRIGGTDIYALGKESGTKPAVLYDEDSRIYGVGETANTLYDIYSAEGRLIISYPVDDAEKYDKKTLYVSAKGSLYEYIFSDEGEITAETCDPAGKTGTVINGLDEVRYYYGASPLSAGYGLADAEDYAVIPAIYTSFTPIFKDRIIAEARNGFGMMNTCRIYDNEGNIICEKYHEVIYKRMNAETNEWLGIGYVANPESQIESVCRDEEGKIMASGFRFIDKDGKELSGVFTDDIKDEISSEEMLLTLTAPDGSKMEADLNDYIFIP
ncbi:MAG: hypothetical protein E7489_06575 [Ruminococcaceae bacterium]|nr:hypothetical protein [Oscillospiraceae bacterium]